MIDDVLMTIAEIGELCSMAIHIAERIKMKSEYLEDISGKDYEGFVENMQIDIDDIEVGATCVWEQAGDFLKAWEVNETE